MASRRSSTWSIAVGKRFGRLVVTGPSLTTHGFATYPVRCDCGNERAVRGISLISGHSQSCGCLHRERASQSMSKLLHKHGDSCGGEYRQLYDAWKNMKKRCDNPKYREFHLYGGRGISYETSWKEYDKFKEWALSAGFQPGLTIERKDVNGNYVPENCIFVSAKHQAQNRRKRSYKEGIAASSSYKGVSAYGFKWMAYIGFENKQINLGYYPSEPEAAHAYNVASQRLFNAWAVRNEIPEGLLTEEMKVSIADRVNRLLDQKQLVS